MIKLLQYWRSTEKLVRFLFFGREERKKPHAHCPPLLIY